MKGEQEVGIIPHSPSFQTNFSSILDTTTCPEASEAEKAIGFVIKGSMDEVYKQVFSKLKEMNIIWKKWNSDFVYKCQSGIPIVEGETTEERQEKFKELFENDMIKFFLQFSTFTKKKGLVDLNQSIKHQYQFLVSFIWIKGPTMKYLDFVSNLQFS